MLPSVMTNIQTSCGSHCARCRAEEFGAASAGQGEGAGCSLVLLPALLRRLEVCDAPLAHRLVHSGQRAVGVHRVSAATADHEGAHQLAVAHIARSLQVTT